MIRNKIMKCCIVGIGKHCQANLVPALIKLQDEKLIVITHLCRNNVQNGDAGLGVSVSQEFPSDVDFIVVCGHPDLHKKAINFSNKTGIPCFIEKPHLLVDQYVNEKIMIGYNFNFMTVFQDQQLNDFDGINCGMKGTYRSWPDLFPFDMDLEEYYHAFHSVIVHPISVMIQKFGAPDKVTVKTNQKDLFFMADEVDITMLFHYGDKIKFLNYTSKAEQFYFDIIVNNSVINCKQYKPDSYYHMLKYYVQSKFKPTINNVSVGTSVLSVINDCLAQLQILYDKSH